MDLFNLLWKTFPFLLFLGYGAYSILEVVFPALRSSDFNRWEIDEETGPTVQIMGWKKALSPPRVLASGYLSERSACTLSLGLGVILIAVGVFGIRHVAGAPSWLPDLFDFSH
jgi:hypothetical protein